MLPALLKAGSALAKGGAPKNKINPKKFAALAEQKNCLLYTSPSPRDVEESRMPSSA